MARQAHHTVRRAVEEDEQKWNKTVNHPVQSWEWGEFRKKTGLVVIRFFAGDSENPQGFQITLHKIPHTPWTIGYIPKCNMPTNEVIEELKKIGKEYNCIYIQIEPHVALSTFVTLSVNSAKGIFFPRFNRGQNDKSIRPSLRPLFFKYTFLIDLTRTEEELLHALHPKTRYNIKIATRSGVIVEERTDNEAFETFLKLYFETTKRQNYFGHTEKYHRLLWETLRLRSGQAALSARILIAYYTPPTTTTTYNLKPITLASWMIFKFGDTIYYPYGGSSDKHRNVMANNLVAWEAIKLGKRLKAKQLDLWGCLGPNANPKDPWYGFHRFKSGYGGKLTEYVGSYDLVLNPLLYFFFHAADRIRLLLLRLKII